MKRVILPFISNEFHTHDITFSYRFGIIIIKSYLKI